MLENAYQEAVLYGFECECPEAYDDATLARKIIAHFELNFLWDISDYWTGNFIVTGVFE